MNPTMTNVLIYSRNQSMCKEKFKTYFTVVYPLRVLTGGGGDYGREPPSAPVFPVCKRMLEPEQPDAPCENPHEGAALHLQLLPQVLHGSQQQAQTRAEQTCRSIRRLVILIKILMLTPPVLSFVFILLPSLLR
jgi:hypothetical protein